MMYNNTIQNLKNMTYLNMEALKHFSLICVSKVFKWILQKSSTF